MKHDKCLHVEANGRRPDGAADASIAVFAQSDPSHIRVRRCSPAERVGWFLPDAEDGESPTPSHRSLRANLDGIHELIFSVLIRRQQSTESRNSQDNLGKNRASGLIINGLRLVNFGFWFVSLGQEREMSPPAPQNFRAGVNQ